MDENEEAILKDSEQQVETAEIESPSTVEQSIEHRASHAWRALRHRNFQLFVGGQSISLIGTWMTRIATGWLVYRLTGSALLLGTVSFAGQIPTFLLAPFAGVWVDRLNRHQVLVWTQTLAMVQSLLLAALTLSGRITVPWVLALSAMQGLINAFDIPGRQASFDGGVWQRAFRWQQTPARKSSDTVTGARLRQSEAGRPPRGLSAGHAHDEFLYGAA